MSKAAVGLLLCVSLNVWRRLSKRLRIDGRAESSFVEFESFSFDPSGIRGSLTSIFFQHELPRLTFGFCASKKPLPNNDLADHWTSSDNDLCLFENGRQNEASRLCKSFVKL